MSLVRTLRLDCLCKRKTREEINGFSGGGHEVSRRLRGDGGSWLSLLTPEDVPSSIQHLNMVRRALLLILIKLAEDHCRAGTALKIPLSSQPTAVDPSMTRF